MRGVAKPLIISILIVAALIAVLLWPSKRSVAPSVSDGGVGDGGAASRGEEGGSALMFYCAAGIKNPVADVVAAYEKEYGVRIRLDYAGSGTLLSKLEVAGKGDLYLAGDSSYTDMGRRKGLIAETIPVAYLRPVIAVPKGNPKGIQAVQDLLREDLRVALGAPEAASIGKQGQRLLEAIGVWESLSGTVRARGVFKPTVNEIANDVKLGAVDAGIVWDATVKQYPELGSVALEGSEDFVQDITVGVLAASRQPMAALRFARYLTARDRGLPAFKKHGFPVVEGDKWAETPEILYFSGGVNRVAIEATLKEFQEREGCVIKTVYNGCGILVGQMKLGERPDAYHSCDVSFMRDVGELFKPYVDVSQTEMVIVTAKGNPLNIRTLGDLGQEGLRIGLANEEQSALGALTARMLKEQGIYEPVSKNVVTNTPTADLLVNQMVTGALDAIVVYEANMTYQRDNLDIVRIGTDSAVAVQTYAIGNETEYPNLLARLLKTLDSVESKERYRQSGFHEVAAQ